MQIQTALSLLPAGLLLVVACSVPDFTEQDEQKSRTCVANQTLVCACGLDRGSQTCSSSGKLSPCDCSQAGKKKADDVDRDPASTPLGSGPREPQSGDDPPPSSSGGTSSGGTSSGGTSGGTSSGGTPELGPSCKKLKVCCDNFIAQGIFADFCLESLNTGIENVCYTKHQSYVNDPEGVPCPP